MSEMIKRIDGVTDGAMRRVEIFRRDDGCFQFLERHLQAPEWGSPHASAWPNLHRSGLYQSADEVEFEARKFLEQKRPDVFRD